MPTLIELQNRIQKAIDAYGRTVEREIAYNYAAALDAIRVDLAKVYERYAVNGKLTHAEMSKFNRLRNLESQIVDEMKPVFAKDQRLIDKMKSVTYEESFYRTAWAIDQSSGVALRWGLLNAEAVKAAVYNDFTELAFKKLRQDGLIKAQRAIRQGIIQGSSYPKMARLIRDQLIKPSMSDALRIARTEGQRAMVQGQQATYNKAEDLGVEMEQVWDAALDSRTRASHGKLDGVAAKKDENGYYWDTDVGRVPGPLQSGVASFDIHCRCRIRGQLKGYGPEVRRERDEGLQPYQTYDEWKANQNQAGRSVSDKPKVKPTPVVGYQKAFASMQPAEQKIFIDAFDPGMKTTTANMLSKMPPVSTVLRSGAGWYEARTRTLNLGSSKSFSTARHELGHHIDHMMFTPSPFADDYLKALENTKKKYWGGSNAAKANVERVRNDLYNKMAKKIDSYQMPSVDINTGERIMRTIEKNIPDPYLSDYFGALTKNKIGQGHSSNYYAQGVKIDGLTDKQWGETFADMLEIYTREDQKVWNYIKTETPEMTEVFEKWLKSL